MNGETWEEAVLVNGETWVEVTGPVTRAEVVSWRDALRDALADGRSLRVDLADTGPWDVAGLQLILALKVSCERDGRGLALANPPGGFHEIAGKAGLRDRFEAIVTS